jgi:predicted MFS family arabinose efflux permease
MLAALALTQTVGYGVLYYAFAVVLNPIATDLHTSTAAVTGALTLAVLTTATAAVPVGRWLDRHSGRALMTAGSVLGTGAVAAWSQVHSIGELYAVFAVIGVASAMVLYEPAFAIIVARVLSYQRSSALLAVTIVAGFASSIFFPLTGVLVAQLGWRVTLLVLAGLFGAITIPLHACALPAGSAPHALADAPAAASGRQGALKDPGFWLLTAAFTAHTGAVAVMSVHLVAYLVRLGHPPGFAATVAGALGALSVTGRVATTGLSRRWPISAVTVIIFVLQAIAVALLPAVGSSHAGAVTCVVVFGLGFGVGTIARPAVLADRYGVAGYAGIAGALALPATIAKAAAPLAAAMLATSIGGYAIVMAATAIACAAAGGLLGIAAARRS